MACIDKHTDFYAARTCKSCKGLIRNTSVPGYCDKCAPLIENAYSRIKKYLSACPGATTFEIQRALDLPIKIINHLIADGAVYLDLK